MSTRGTNFLHQWIATNIPERAKADEVSIDVLTRRLLTEGEAVGIERGEIGEEVDTLYRVFVEAIAHLDPGIPE
jgi:hypothetical protein